MGCSQWKWCHPLAERSKEMTKSKNHTTRNQSAKAHGIGIKKLRKHRSSSTKVDNWSEVGGSGCECNSYIQKRYVTDILDSLDHKCLKSTFLLQTDTPVVYSKYVRTEVEFNVATHLLLKEDDIVGILETRHVKDLNPLNQGLRP
ncbi:20 kDa chaperonin, chloroplastic-like protein [Tanacetum coccineum]